MSKTTPAGRPNPESFGLPVRLFLYTLDQVAMMLALKESKLVASYIYFEGRSTGLASKDLIRARNIAPRHAAPEWRISEQEMVRWLKHKGYRIYERGGVVE